MEKNKNNITELVFIVDESGSMSGLESDTIGGINSMLTKQKELDGKVYVTTVMFSNSSRTVHDRVDISGIKPVTGADYCPHGCTALLDAIGGTIKHIANIHRYIRPEDVPEHTVFVITTDGMENASRLYSSEEVKRMIRHEEEKYGWEFMFLAANIDAVETAEAFGIRPERAANYISSPMGERKKYSAVNNAVSELRCCSVMSDSWKKDLDGDD